MNANYQFKCITCGKIFQANNAPEYVCPICSEKQEAGKSLLGVLECLYDYEEYKLNHIRENAGREVIFPPAVFPPLKVGNTPLYQSETLRKKIDIKNLWLKDETVEPTGSYKDRASYLVVAMAQKKGYDKITCASTGNAASSLAGICASAGIESYIFVSASAPRAKLVQLAAYGANLFPINGNYDTCFELSLQATKKFGWYNRNTAYNPWTIEGKKTAAWEIACQLNFELPDQVFVPTGDGVIISGIYKGFFDLLQLGWIEKIPQLVAVQPEGSDAIVKALTENEKNISKIFRDSADSVADSLVVNAPRNAEMALRSLKMSDGYGLTVSDDEIIKAIAEVSSSTGIFVEPAASTAWAGIKEARETGKISANQTAAILLTGTGLKDIASAEKATQLPSPVEPNLEAVASRLAEIQF